MDKILLLVEGKNKEKELFEHFYRLYDEKNIEVVSYKTNIYAFYNDLKKRFRIDSDDEKIEYEVIDLALFLNDHLKLQDNELYNKNEFVEKILVFDFDPHDSNYSADTLMELMKNFSNPRRRGKLYLNYPMLESFKDMESLEDENFMDSTFLKSMIKEENKGYKYHIDQQARKNKINRIDKIDKETASKLIHLHRQKLEFITKLPTSASEKYLHLCQKQCKKLSEEDLMWVINTSILHLYDEYGALEGDTVCPS